eukprot:gnl/TRDRNA2_/TRDRNA2_177661_c10_seq1.p1 gnl/TRDRNA2_/TRDRNA2_177661_c10~~gnl/TRDRNA2_/TRDRNA2_177661_c10_seq1.p1  ORF type:complete len:899 (+),score=218.17 gnl/TRDRNA2_/TRDRNA2_177661_c10_seq1:93-2699(+)
MKVALSFILVATVNAASVTQSTRRVVALNQEASLFGMRTQMHMNFASSQALEHVMKNMTVQKALSVVGEQRLAGLPNDVRLMLEGANSLRKKPKGYGAVDGVIKMLNNMTDESEKKLDIEQATCADYEKNQLGQIEGTRQDISAYDAKAAAAKGEVLAAGTQINLIGGKLPKLKGALSEHNAICKKDIGALLSQLAVVQGDIKVMTKVVKMAKCDGSFIQVQKCSSDAALLQDKKSHRRHELSLISVQQSSLMDDLDLLQHPYSKMLVQEDIDELYRLTESPPSFVETDAVLAQPKAKPTNSTDDPSRSKAQRKCSIKDNPNCQHMRDKFLQILSGIQDKEGKMLRQLSKLRYRCDLQTKNLEAQIDDHESRLKEQQALLAQGTKDQNEAEGNSRLKNIELKTLQKDYAKMMAKCKNEITKYQTEICGFKKIRQEVLKIEGIKVFIADCQLSAWTPEDCSVTCGGGTQKLTRKIVQYPVGGAPCQPLTMMQPCNTQGCPVDCEMNKWSSWSGCSAKCGGGVKSKTRGIKTEPKNGGVPCGETSMADTCNAQACDQPCKLKKWSRWSQCSKRCGGGLQHRSRGVRVPAKGAGKCPRANARPQRLQYKRCNSFPCPPPPKSKSNKYGVQQCEAKLDVVLMIDGSGSLGKQGWIASKKAAEMFVAGFNTGDDKKINARMAILLYSGPRTWADLYLCVNGPKKGQKPPDMKKNCGIMWISKSEDGDNHFEKDFDSLQRKTRKMKWLRATTLTSVALMQVSDELKFGRKDAASLVIVITDGRPMSPSKTFQASRKLRTRARLMWVPVTRYAPIRDIKKWASKPLKENMIMVPSWKQFQRASVISDIIENACPKVSMPPGYAKKAALKRAQMKR